MARILAYIGKAAFIIGVLFAIFGGIWGGDTVPTNKVVIIALLASGIVIGLLNITTAEATPVLAASIALVILGIWGLTPAFEPVRTVSATLADNVIGVVTAFALLMAPTAIIIALKAVINAAKPGDVTVEHREERVRRAHAPDYSEPRVSHT